MGVGGTNPTPIGEPWLRVSRLWVEKQNLFKSRVFKYNNGLELNFKIYNNGAKVEEKEEGVKWNNKLF